MSSPVADSPTTAINVAGITFPHVVLNASGCFNPSVFNTLSPLEKCLGGIVSKTVTTEPRTGNPQQRTVELPGIGMLNSIGLQNPGLTYFLEQEIPQFAQYNVPIVASLSAASAKAFGTMAKTIMSHPNGTLVSALELNLSCPNVAEGGVDFGLSPTTVSAVVQTTVDAWPKPIFAKLTPNITSMLPVAEAAINSGAQGITAINTLLGTSINLKTQQPYLNRVSGGYSGPGIKPVALHHVWQLHRAFPETPIIGVGGIQSTDDALEFLLAGASLVQVGTHCFRRPMAFQQFKIALSEYLQQAQLTDFSQLTGLAHKNHSQSQR